MKKYLLQFINLWPPFLFSGIKVVELSKDFRHAKVQLKLRFWNANYVRTQYGGALFSMTDPFYMLMLIENLGSDYAVWDKSATICYLRPGRTDVFAEFHLSEEELSKIYEQLAIKSSLEWTRTVQIKDKQGELIAEVYKVISIKKKRDHKN